MGPLGGALGERSRQRLMRQKMASKWQKMAAIGRKSVQAASTRPIEHGSKIGCKHKNLEELSTTV
jgi:hypothetical protein